jgi:hypothetical protein
MDPQDRSFDEERLDGDGVPDMPPREAVVRERNAFMESLPIEAKERFLARLQECADRGMDEESAWREAVVAAETTYEPAEARDL